MVVEPCVVVESVGPPPVAMSAMLVVDNLYPVAGEDDLLGPDRKCMGCYRYEFLLTYNGQQLGLLVYSCFYSDPMVV